MADENKEQQDQEQGSEGMSSGGGSGGTVAVLGRTDAEPAVLDIAHRYAAMTGHEPFIFRGSSPGSAAFGNLVVQRIQ